MRPSISRRDLRPALRRLATVPGSPSTIEYRYWYRPNLWCVRATPALRRAGRVAADGECRASSQALGRDHEDRCGRCVHAVEGHFAKHAGAGLAQGRGMRPRVSISTMAGAPKSAASVRTDSPVRPAARWPSAGGVREPDRAVADERAANFRRRPRQRGGQRCGRPRR